MRGLTLQVTNATSAPLTVTDVSGLATFAAGETRNILYTDDVQSSLEYGRLNALIIAGSVTVQFVSGTNLSQAPIGRTFTGATPSVAGIPGLVPEASVANRGYYLKGDGTWSVVTALSIGGIPESKLTTQGDLIVRGLTTSERLPIGTLGQILRAGPVQVQWESLSTAGLLVDRPVASAFYTGRLYWATDAAVGHQLSICYFNGAIYDWFDLGSGGGGGATPWVIDLGSGDTDHVIVPGVNVQVSNTVRVEWARVSAGLVLKVCANMTLLGASADVMLIDVNDLTVLAGPFTVSSTAQMDYSAAVTFGVASVRRVALVTPGVVGGGHILCSSSLNVG
jgi:hypothetical protein